MKKVLLLVPLVIFLSCDFKDKNGNAPLIDDGTGKLIDNPNYKTDAEYKYNEEMAPARAAYKESLKDGSDIPIKDSRNPTVAERESFSKSFKPNAGGKEIKISDKDKTTITFTSPFNNQVTLEQFENLNYFKKLKDLGFKKVNFSDGDKIVASKNLE